MAEILAGDAPGQMCKVLDEPVAEPLDLSCFYEGPLRHYFAQYRANLAKARCTTACALHDGLLGCR